MKMPRHLAIICLIFVLCSAHAKATQRQSRPAQLPKYLTLETAQQLGAIWSIDLPRTGTKPFRPALALPDGSLIEESIETTIFKGDLEIERGVYRASCEPATRSLVRISATGRVLWAKSYFIRDKNVRRCDKVFYGFDVHSVLSGGDSTSIYLMPEKSMFLLELGLRHAPSPFILFDIETGMPTTHVPANVRIVDAQEVRSMKQKFVDKWFKRHSVPEDKPEYAFPKMMPSLYKELGREIFRRPVHTSQPNRPVHAEQTPITR